MPSRDANGRALPGLFRFYMPSSGGIPKTVYVDAGLTVPHEFPIASDGGGRWPQIWADDGQAFDVGWSDQVFDATIKTFSNVQTVKDALLASADIANAAADAAIAAEAVTVGIAAKFGDVDGAIDAANQARDDAQTAAAAAEQTLNGPGGVVELRDQTQDLRDEAEQFRNEAQDIAGFDPTTYLNTGAVQAFSEPAKTQGRANIGAQPVLAVVDRQKVATASIVAGVLTLDAATASVWVVEWDAAITSLVINGWAAGTDQQTLSLWLIADGGTAYSFGAAFKPLNNVQPTLEDTAGRENLLQFTTRNAGARVCFALSGFFPA